MMAAAKAKTVTNGDGPMSFEGKTVVASAVRVTGAGDGLSEAMSLEPQDLHHGEEVWLVIHGRVGRVSYDPIKKAEDVLQRVHTIRAEECIMVAPDQVEGLLSSERDRIERLKEERAGVSRLPLNTDPLGILDDPAE